MRHRRTVAFDVCRLVRENEIQLSCHHNDDYENSPATGEEINARDSVGRENVIIK